MKVAMVINRGRVASCFAGADIWIVEAGEPRAAGHPLADGDYSVLQTGGWHPPHWGCALSHHGVTTLICVGIPLPVWAILSGKGIAVIPNVMAEASEAIAAWHDGELRPPENWPPDPPGLCPGGMRGRGMGRGGGGGRGRGPGQGRGRGRGRGGRFRD